MTTVLDQSIAGASGTSKRAAATRPAWMLFAIIVALLLPEEINFTPFGFRLAIARIFLFLALPWAVLGFARLMTYGQYRFVLSDLLVAMAGLWLILAPSIVDGVGSGIVKGGSLALDFWIVYAVFRVAPKRNEDVYALIKFLCIGLAVVGFLAVLDPLTGGPTMHKLAAAMMGSPTIANWQDSSEFYRFGFFRAASTLEHPIVMGIAMVYGLLLARGLVGWWRVFCALGCLVGLLAAMSSAPLLAAAMSVVFLTYRAIFPWKHRWTLLVLLGGGAAIVFLLVHPAPFSWIFSHLLLDPQTGYYRLLTWQYAGENVLNSPLWGLGLVDAINWPRPKWLISSVDSMWLRTAMQCGIPASVLIGLSMIAVCRLPVRLNGRPSASNDTSAERFAEGIGIILFLTIFLGFTVDYWGTCWMLVGLLSGLRVSLYQIAVNERAAQRRAANYA